MFEFIFVFKVFLGVFLVCLVVGYVDVVDLVFFVCGLF